MMQSQPVQPGSFSFPPQGGKIPPTSTEAMDDALQLLTHQKKKWAQESIPVRLSYIETLIRDFTDLAPQWVDDVTASQHISGDDFAIGSEWMSGPYAVMRYLRCLQQALVDIGSQGCPRIPGPVVRMPNGQLSAQVFPQTMYDRLLFNGYRAEVWMEPDGSPENLHRTQARAYLGSDSDGVVSLVLGAGNLAGIPVTDALDRLFVHKQVVLLKMNPVNDKLGPLFERGFHFLVEAGYLRIVYGGVEEGVYLCRHASVDEVFITGSDKTFDAIVFGPGEAGALRKAQRKPLLEKPVSGELGNVTPAIVVPGEWSQEDLEYQAENIASWFMGNAGMACNTPRVLVLHREWPQYDAFLEAFRKICAAIPLRYAFYPGSQQRYRSFLDAHPEAEQYGEPEAGKIPWTLIPEVDIENQGDLCFTIEAFCPVIAAAPVSSPTVPEYLDRVVRFCNQTLWGTLAAGLFVHPKSMQDPAVKAAFDAAIATLRYGTVAINSGAGVSWLMMTTPWGAYPGSNLYDIQSGNSFVHNSLMFSKIQKTILHGRFRENPRPIAFVSRGRVMRKLGPKLVDLMAGPKLWKLPGILITALGK